MRNQKCGVLKSLGVIKLGAALLGMALLLFPVTGYAMDFNGTVNALKTKFPHGKYWNHVGSTVDNPDGYTDSPCTLHKTDGIHIQGTGGCTCNHFVSASHGGKTTQCMGFAYKLGYDVFGETTWTTNPEPNAVSAIRVGDIVRLSGYHSVFVISRTGNLITVGEANYPNSCHISWDRMVDLTTVTISYYERADNYDAVMGAAVTPPVSGTEETPASGGSVSGETPVSGGNTFDKTSGTGVASNGKTTGWQLSEDGVHYYYLKNGKPVTSDWITEDKKKYYMDEAGFRVIGRYKVGQWNYYFDGTGVMQKEKWFDLDGETYYADKEGIVLESQWLYLNGVLVYVTKDGSVARKELVEIGGSTYYFNAKGKRSKGFKKVGGKYYYCNNKGIIQKKKWVTKGGKKYYLQKSGVRVQDKLVKIGKYRYYFNSKGQMVTKKKVSYKGTIYKADRYGHCRFLSYIDE